MNLRRLLTALVVILAVASIGVLLFMWASAKSEVEFSMGTTSTSTSHLQASSTVATSTALLSDEKPVTHMHTPEPLYAAYMTSCIASGKRLRAPLVNFVDKTQLNALIIDIKDFSGKLSIDTGDSHFVVNDNGCTISDIKDFIAELHQKDTYVIGRVAVMQDSTYTKSHPAAAVQKHSGPGIWKDRKGLSFIDPGATEYWQYMVDLGKASHALGFDEINYDYIRYPTDGDMSDAFYSRSSSTSKPEMMKRFYEYLGKGMHEAGIPISADLFGMTTTNMDDLGIGQVLENALPNFDYVAPMVYPSHFPMTYNGWKDPNLVPYEIIKFTMSTAVKRANELEKKNSGWNPVITVVSTTTGAISTTTNPTKFVPTGMYANRLRPWLEDFDCCAPNAHHYTEADVRAQMKGTYDSGLTSWMMWDPRNAYTESAYDPATRADATTSQ